MHTYSVNEGKEIGGRSSDSLFSTTRLARDGTPRRSVVVVGLPRSGSSFLSHVMSQIPDWYVFDDLYVAREARALGVTGPIDARRLDKLLHFLGWQIRARLRFGTYAIPNVAEDEIEPMNDALRDVFQDSGLDWADLQEEWLVRLAERAGARNWGYKQPGAFRQIDELLTTYPEMKAVFLMRAPEKVLASYKHMPADSQDGDPAQYHPLAHAAYWRMAAKAWPQAQARWPGRVMLLRFEDLVADPTKAARELASFLGTAPPVGEVTPPPRPNTSFDGGKRKGLTRLEDGLTRAITGSAREALGFAPAPAPDGPFGIGDFLRTTGTFLAFRSGKLVEAVKRRLGK